MIADIADEQRTVRRDCHTMRLPELCLASRTAVAAVSRLTRSRDSCDDPAARIHAPHDVILHFDEIHVAGLIEADFIWLIE